MMIYALLLLGLAVTWLPGWLWLSRIVPTGGAGRTSLVAGYSLLFGFIFITIVMRLLSLLGIDFSFVSIAVTAGLFGLAGLLLPRSEATDIQTPVSPGPWEKLLLALCLALIAARLLSLGLETGLRPVYAWDTKQHWGKQARVLFEARDLVPYVSLHEWLQVRDETVYTNIHPDYPITTPLITAWTNLVMGQWHHSFMNLPWVMCYIAIGLIFFGQARAAGASAGVAAAFTYMLLSMPYLNVQVALAGYADLFLAACYMAALAAFCNWSQRRERWQALLAAMFATACLLMKNEGLYWFLSFIPGLMFVYLGVKRGLLAGFGLLLLLALVLWLMPGDLSVGGHSLDRIKLEYRPSSWPAIYQSFLVHDNWHMAGALFVLLVSAGLLLARGDCRRIAGPTATVAVAFCLYLALYLLTRHATGAVRFTSLNRVALQLVPAFWFVAMLYYLALYRTRKH